MNRLFCFGMGFCAKALARNLAPKGWAIGASTRGPIGYQSFPFDSGLRDALHGTTHVLISAPPEGEGDPVLAKHAATLSAISPPLKWLGYLSTTGVYGDHGGNWIDEATPVSPTSQRARRRVAAEIAWLEWGANANVPIHIFRLAGIYGPGRSAIDALRAGTARRIVKPGQVFSRIHVDDVAAVLAASMAHPGTGQIYNVCDDEPAPPHDVVEYAARLIGVSPPPQESFEAAAHSMSAMALSFYAESKRVRNKRIKSELGVTLRYLSYREGLKAIYASGLSTPAGLDTT